MTRTLRVFERVENKRVKCRESGNKRFMHDSVRLLKKRQFKNPSARDLLRLRGRGQVVLAVVRLRSQMRLVGSESRSFSEQSSRFVHLSLYWGGGTYKKKLWLKTGVGKGRKRRSFLREKDRLFTRRLTEKFQTC